MMRSEAITIIKRGLGFRQTQDAAIIAALKQAQRDLEIGHTLPKWMLQHAHEIEYFAYNSGLFTLPPNFLRATDEFPAFYVPDEAGLPFTDTKVFVPKRNYEEAYAGTIGSGRPEEQAEPSQANYPEVWVQLNIATGQFFPRPVKDFKFYMTHYARAQSLDFDIENTWLLHAPNALVGLAGVYVAGDVRDKGAMEKFTMMAKAGATSMLGEVIEEELVGRPLIMGRNN